MRDYSRFGFTIALTPPQPNILVDTAGRVRLTDFGLTLVAQDLGLIRGASAEHGHGVRWIAPEIFDEKGKLHRPSWRARNQRKRNGGGW